MIELVNVYEAYGGTLVNPPDQILEGADAQLSAEDQKTLMHERAIATILVENADKNRFSDVQEQLRNNFSLGTDQYPRTIQGVYQLLLAHHDDDALQKKPRRPRKPRREHGGNGRGNGGGRGNGSQTAPSVSHIALSQLASHHFPHGITDESRID